MPEPVRVAANCARAAGDLLVGFVKGNAPQAIHLGGIHTQAFRRGQNERSLGEFHIVRIRARQRQLDGRRRRRSA